MKNKKESIREMITKANVAYLDGKTFKDRWNKEEIGDDKLIHDIFHNKNKYYVESFVDGILSIKSKINQFPITEKILLFLGFEREDVSAEESGNTPYYYFIYNLKNERAFLISCANDECDKESNYIVEFFNEEEAGYIDNANVLESLINVLKCLKSK